MRDFYRALERVGVDGEAVILRGDLHLSGGQIHHRLVSAVMAELELVGLPAQSEPHDLVAETNSEDRFLADEPLYVLLDIRNRIGIAGTIGEKDPVRIHGQDIFGGRAGGNASYSATRPGEGSCNVVFEIVTVGDT